MQSLLIVVPTYNESQNIIDLVMRLILLYPFADVLVVDDASPDGTADMLEKIASMNPHIFLMRREGKGGRGSAVLDGFSFGLQKQYENFIEMDADFSHKPEEIALLLASIASHDMVVGSRYLPQSEIHEWGMKRTIFSYLANMFARCMLQIPISDYTNGFRCYTRNAVESLRMDQIDARGYVVLSEVAMQIHHEGMRIGEVPTVFVNRRRGISNLTFKEIREAFRSILRIWRVYRWDRKR